MLVPRQIALLCFFLCLTGVFSSRPARYRNVRQTEREPGQITREKCMEYSRIVVEEEPQTFSLIKKKIPVETCRNDGNTLIIGGEKARAKEFPHMALLGYGSGEQKEWLCAGSLISKRYILTAAHCLFAPNIGNCSAVRLGDLKLGDTTDDASPEDYGVSELIKHPEYRYPSQYNDIALLKLDRDVQYSKYIRPACISDVAEVGGRAVATGWGLTAPHANRTDTLLKVTLDLFDQPDCNASFVHKISERRLKFGIVGDTQMCAGSKSGEAKDTCKGDSGGPLQVYHQDHNCIHVVVGVTSIGDSCGVLPGVYSRVFHYLKWLEDTIWPM